MNQPLMARRIKMESNHICDYDGIVIPKGKVAVQVVGDETVLAQGLYHGSGCYQSALTKYEEELKKIKGGEDE